ncbi:MAG TPA: hypothetical protein VGA98_07565 [Allosphingosinicella sp.]
MFVEIYKGEDKRWRWRLLDGDLEVARSVGDYSRRGDAKKGWERLVKAASTGSGIRVVEVL